MLSNKTIRAVIYARFSSDMQREESIDAQVRACREYCKKKGYLVTGIYKDEAKSGKSTLERDEYNRLQKDAKEDLFDVIIMHTKQQQNASSIIKAKNQVKAGLITKLDNLYKLVEDGMCDQRTIGRLKDLQEQISVCDEEIKKASVPISVLTPKEIDNLFNLLEQKIACNDDEARKIMVDTFVDHITITKYEANLTLNFGNLTKDLNDETKVLPDLKIDALIFL